MFNPLNSSTNQQLFEQNLSNKRPLKITIMNGRSHVSITILTVFAVRKDEWYTKEGTEECIVCTVVWQKAPLSLNDEKLALAIVELCQASVSQAVTVSYGRKLW